MQLPNEQETKGGLLRIRKPLETGEPQDVGRISHWQGSISLETRQYPISVIPSSDLAAKPNSKTYVSAGLGTSITTPLYESVDCWAGGVVEEVESEAGSLVFLQLPCCWSSRIANPYCSSKIRYLWMQGQNESGLA